MEPQMSSMFVTFVDKEGPFLRVWGHTDKSSTQYIDQVMRASTPQFDAGLGMLHKGMNLHEGLLCCAKYKDGKYYRARITGLDFLHNRYVQVLLIDYGHRDMVPLDHLRSVESFDNNFIAIPPQAHAFLLAEAVNSRVEWSEVMLEDIAKDIKGTEVGFQIISAAGVNIIARLFCAGQDLTYLLVQRGYMRPAALATQEAVLLSMIPSNKQRTPPPAPPVAMTSNQSIATYKANALEPGGEYPAYVSYVTDGPCNFSIQLQQGEEVLGKLMKDINSMNLTPLEGIPIPGAVCLARCTEDQHICRAVVTNEVDGDFKVYFVDFGNFETLPLDELFEIPFKCIIPKVSAIRFALEGVEKSTVTLEMRCAFKKFVDNRLIHMRVMPNSGRTALPKCELWDPLTGKSALDVVNEAAAAAYPDPMALSRGFCQQVKVSYVFSCSRFYIQLKSKEEELARLMMDIQVICRDSDVLTQDMIKPGQPCYALFQDDEQWYRSLIVDLNPDGTLKVHYVDYGNDEIVPAKFLKPIEGKQLTVLRPQAIECSLNGYQNMLVDDERDSLLEQLILEQEFTMRVVEMQGKKALIELIDAENYNVASRLLEKLASARSQVSPVLVQADNKIEHKRTYRPNEQQFNSQKKFDRNDSFNSGNTPPKGNSPSWRQQQGNDRGRRGSRVDERTAQVSILNRALTPLMDQRDTNADTNTNDSNDSSWRQNNRNFKDRSDDTNNTDNWKKNKSSYSQNYDRNKNDSPGSNDDYGQNKSEKNYDRPFDSNRPNRRDNRNGGDFGGGGRDRDNNRRGDANNRSDDTKYRDQNSGSRNHDDWGGEGDRKPRESNRDDWNNDRKKDFNSGGDRRNYSKSNNDNWGNDDSATKTDGGWGDGGGERKSFNPRDGANSFKKPDWNDSKPGFHKKRDGSERSFGGSDAGSEKGGSQRGGYNKGGPRNDRFGGGNDRGFGGGNKSRFDGRSFGSSAPPKEVQNPAPSGSQFARQMLDGTESRVIISWFYNPAHFYCQLEGSQDDFKQMMQNIQESYKGIPPSTAGAEVGSPVIGLFPDDGVLYRALITEVVGSEYKVQYVDFGNLSLITKIWPIDVKFLELPQQAVCCGIDSIAPASETWPETKSYSAHFENKQFQCKFISTVDDKTSVQLVHDGQDVGELLIRDGVAKSTAVPIEPAEIPMLCGQQFKAMLLSVNNLGDFLIGLPNGEPVSCSVFNLSNATETFDDALKEKLGQFVIVFVDDVADNKLEVTVYDQSGTKIKLIDRDEDAFESVELISAYPVLRSKLHGSVCHVDGTTIYVQPTEATPTIEWMVNELYEYFESFELTAPIVPTEGFVYAVKSSDDNWYRGKVLSFDDEKVEVCFIDYGNTESVEFKALKELTADFMEVSIQCVPVIMTVPTADLQDTDISLSVQYTDEGLEGVVLEVAAAPEVPSAEYVPEQIDESTAPLTESTATLTDSVATVTVEALPVEPEVTEITAQPSPPVEPSRGIFVIVSHQDSPADFYLQLASSGDAIDELQAKLQEQIVEMPDLENPTVGVLCAAPYSVDQLWYRAQVLDVDADESDITTVRFVDFGNTDVLENKVTRVKTLPPELLSLEVHATRCRLKIKPIEGSEWSAAAFERFQDLTNIDQLTALFISQDEKLNYVELYSDGHNVSDLLIEEGLASPDCDVINIDSKNPNVAFVSHINSPSEFWVQLENCIDELEWIVEQLSSTDKLPELADLTPGTLCAALFPDDQQWYRARILSNTVAGIDVLFIDYGNSCASCSLRELREDLVMLPPLAQKCSLQKPEGLQNWSPEMARKFVEIAAEGQTTFTVRKVSTGETSVVDLLLDDGGDVATMLLPTTEEVTVKFSNSLDELVLVKQMNDEEIDKKYKLETLPDSEWNDESIKKFAELNNEGKTVFQAEFVSEDTVRLYVNFNDVRLEMNATKKPPVPTSSTPSPIKTRTPAELTSANIVEPIMSDIVSNAVDDEEVQTVESVSNDVIVDATTEIKDEDVAETTEEKPSEILATPNETKDDVTVQNEKDDEKTRDETNEIVVAETEVVVEADTSDVTVEKEAQEDVAEKETSGDAALPVTNIVETEIETVSNDDVITNTIEEETQEDVAEKETSVDAALSVTNIVETEIKTVSNDDLITDIIEKETQDVAEKESSADAALRVTNIIETEIETVSNDDVITNTIEKETREDVAEKEASGDAALPVTNIVETEIKTVSNDDVITDIIEKETQDVAEKESSVDAALPITNIIETEIETVSNDDVTTNTIEKETEEDVAEKEGSGDVALPVTNIVETEIKTVTNDDVITNTNENETQDVAEQEAGVDAALPATNVDTEAKIKTVTNDDAIPNTEETQAIVAQKETSESAVKDTNDELEARLSQKEETNDATDESVIKSVLDDVIKSATAMKTTEEQTEAPDATKTDVKETEKEKCSKEDEVKYVSSGDCDTKDKDGIQDVSNKEDNVEIGSPIKTHE